MKMLTRTLRYVSGFALTALAANTAVALEGGTSSYLKGSRDFLGGIVPVEPGVYMRNDIAYYDGSVDRTLLSGKVQGKIEARLLVNLIRPTFVTPWELFGGTYAFGFTLPLVNAKLTGTLVRPKGTNEREEHQDGLGDAILTPVLLGWHNGNWHFNSNLSIWVPTGSYKDGRVLNTGKNYWSLSPQVGITYLNPTTGWDFSATGVYLLNFENSATNYHSGDVLHFDFAAGRSLNRSFKIGVVGYALQQITGDSGEGATLGDLKARVYGFGPAATLTFPVGNTPVSVTGKYYKEFGAANTTEGDEAVVSISFKF